jgi:hypothetical protein
MRNATLMIVPNRKRRCYHYEQIRFLAENRSVDVIVCVMPNEMFDSITTSASDEDSKESELEHNFRRILKARCMHLGTPLQAGTREDYPHYQAGGRPAGPGHEGRLGTSARRSTTRATGRSRGGLSRTRRSCGRATSASASTRAGTGNGVVESGPGLRRVRARDHPSARRCRSTRRTVIRI